ncbi:hypothetical protein GMMP13_120014 [Candidatus Magnetomoraceae bacterium gMMP-13]
MACKITCPVQGRNPLLTGASFEPNMYHSAKNLCRNPLLTGASFELSEGLGRTGTTKCRNPLLTGASFELVNGMTVAFNPVVIPY